MARTKGKRKPALLKGLKFDEVSLVGSGANQGAHVSILKMEEEPGAVAKRMFNEVLAEMKATDEQRAIIRDLEKMSYVFADTIWPVMTDSDYPDKKQAIKENLSQFTTAMISMVDSADVIKGLEEIAKATKTEGGKSFPAKDYAYVPDPDKPSSWKLRLTSTPGGPPDPRIIGAAVAALGPGFRGQKVQLPAGSLASVKAKVRQAWKKANPDKSREDMPEVLKKEEIPVKDSIQYFQTLAKMNDIQKTAFVALTEDEQAAIVKEESMDTRLEMVQAKVKKETPAKKVAKTDDETIECAGITIYKSEVGDGVFAFMKSQQIELADAKKVAKAEQEKRITKELEAEAETMFPNYPGTAVEKGLMLKNIRSLPVADQEVQIKMLKAGDAAIEGQLKVSGDDFSGELKKGEDRLDAMAKEIQKANPALTFEKAYAQAMRTPEGEAAYDQHQ